MAIDDAIILNLFSLGAVYNKSWVMANPMQPLKIRLTLISIELFDLNRNIKN